MLVVVDVRAVFDVVVVVAAAVASLLLTMTMAKTATK